MPTRLDIATFCLIMMGCGSLVAYHISLVCSYFGILLFHWTYNIQRPGLSVHWSQESSNTILHCHLWRPQRPTWTREAFMAKSIITISLSIPEDVFIMGSILQNWVWRPSRQGDTPQQARADIARSMGGPNWSLTMWAWAYFNMPRTFNYGLQWLW